MSLRLFAAALAALFLVFVSTTGPASAHATLVSSNPKDGSSVESEPTSVSLTFNEDVSTPAQLQVTGPDGSELADGEPVVEGTAVSQQVTTSGTAGTYTIAYRVVSADGHPITGELSYDVTSGERVDNADPEPAESFTERHGSHLALGGVAVVVALGLLVWPWIRRRA